jgi:RNA polymerase subunit RPABC4/transcription elongation factor Spt4
MFRECCPECGHMLSLNRGMCPFCDWDENSDHYSYSIRTMVIKQTRYTY